MNVFKWRQITASNLPSSSGIYAWYYRVRLSSRDLERLFESMGELDSERDKRRKVKDFLERHLFGFFREDPYEITVTGALKPRYRGCAHHESAVSTALVDRIVNDPAGLSHVKEVIEKIGHNFASPIYIGMAENLARRLTSHKHLIEMQKDRANVTASGDAVAGEDETFAKRVVSRGYIETNLYVVVEEVPAEMGVHNMIENILNRVNYPILGRN